MAKSRPVTGPLQVGGAGQHDRLVFMATLDGSIVIIALPAIFRGIDLDPLAPGNIVYLLWMIMGYRLVQAVLVVGLGPARRHVRPGEDLQRRLRRLHRSPRSCSPSTPSTARSGAMWLIGWRLLQAIGGIDADGQLGGHPDRRLPADQRGFALGTNQIAGLAGQFIGLVAGGLLAAIDWRAVFWVNVPVGVFGTLWAYRRLRGDRRAAPRPHGLVGQHHLRRRPGAILLVGVTVRHPALRRPGHGLDEPDRDRPAGRRRGAARRVRA